MSITYRLFCTGICFFVFVLASSQVPDTLRQDVSQSAIPDTATSPGTRTSSDTLSFPDTAPVQRPVSEARADTAAFQQPVSEARADTAPVQRPVSEALADTAAVQEAHSPRKAAIYSAALPGLGQIYNKKYWKVPIVYIGLGSFIGSTIYNARNYSHYRKKYIHMIENDLEEYEDQILPEVKWYKDTHRRYRDLFVIVTAGFYALQIIDASVDAHLFNFDISDDLSMRLDPVFISPGPAHSTHVRQSDAATGTILPAQKPAATYQSTGAHPVRKNSLGLRCCLYF